MYRFNEELLDMINSHIVRVAKEEVRKAIKDMYVETYQDMKVTKVNTDGTVNIVDMVTGENYSNVLNKSGENIAVDEIVRMYCDSSNKKYVGIKM